MAVFLFLGLWGVKLEVISRYGSDLPAWDQMPGEGLSVILPWIERHELWGQLIAQHNEHRIAPTRAVDLGLTMLGGQWDMRVQCVVNAAIYSAMAALLYWWAARRLPRAWSDALGIGLVLAIAPSLPWDNVISGLQGCFYFLIEFSLFSIGALLTTRVFGGWWWAGLAAGLVAIVSMGSGFLCAVPVAAMALLDLIFSSRSRRDALANLAAGLLIGGLGLWLYHAPSYHEGLRAHSVTQFLQYAVRGLAWPAPQWPITAAVFWTPWLVLTYRRFAKKGELPAAVDFPIAAGGWVLLQIVAMSYARGGGEAAPSVRYGDIIGLGIVVGIISLAFLFRCVRWPAIASMGAYLVVVVVTIGVAARGVWTTDLPERRSITVEYENSSRDFVATDDPRVLDGRPLAYPQSDWLQMFLRLPLAREMLPTSVRQPLRIAGFEENGRFAPSLAHRRFHAMTGTSSWTSGELPAGTGWWALQVAGGLGAPGASLDIVAKKDGRILGSVSPSKLAGNGWRTAYVKAPAESAVFVAKTAGPATWFAFSEPVEMTTLSYWMWALAKQGRWLLAGGLLGCLLLAVVGRTPWNSQSRPAGSASAV